MPAAPSGYARALSALSDAGVSFVIVGVGGINFYARTPAEAFATLDLDALLEPSAANLGVALRVLHGLGFDFEAAGEPFADWADADVLQRVVERGASLSALHPDVGEIDLMLSIAGISFDALALDAVGFDVAGTRVPVGRLGKLLSAKEAAGRPKDIEFLRAYRARADDEA